MIGDNPKSDIEGANKRDNWISILVKTGVYKPGESTNNAKHVVEDMKEAYNLILKLENLQN